MGKRTRHRKQLTDLEARLEFVSANEKLKRNLHEEDSKSVKVTAKPDSKAGPREARPKDDGELQVLRPTKTGKIEKLRLDIRYQRKIAMWTCHGYGFTRISHTRIYVHVNQLIDRSQHRKLRVGAKMTFMIEENREGYIAKDIRVLR